MRDHAIELCYQWSLEENDPFFEQAQQICLDNGWTPLNVKTTRILYAFEGTRLVGFHVLQLFPHCEPLWVTRDYIGAGLAEELADRMLEFLTACNARGFMVIADNPHAVKLCEARGMKRVTSPVFLM